MNSDKQIKTTEINNDNVDRMNTREQGKATEMNFDTAGKTTGVNFDTAGKAAGGANKIDQLQFLRFLAFLLVFQVHTAMWMPSWLPGSQGGINALCFFFILSGSLAGYSAERKPTEVTFTSWTHYIKGKLVKLYPLYFLTTVFTVLYSFSLYGPVQLVKNLLLIQSWFPQNYFSYNGVGWFLSTMLFLYALTNPAKSILYKISSAKRGVMYTLGLMILMMILEVIYCYSTRNLNIEFWGNIFPISRVCEYFAAMCVGCLAAKCIKWFEKRNVGGTKMFTIAEVFMLVFCFAFTYTPYLPWMVRIVKWFIPNALLIFVFMFGKGYVSKLFKSRVCVVLGNISFEYYLIHQIVISIVGFIVGIIFGDAILSSGVKFMFAVISLFITLGVSFVYNRLEKKIADCLSSIK